MIYLFAVVFYTCKENPRSEQGNEQIVVYDSTSVVLEFSMTVDKKTYQKTNYGDPPQFAIWIENNISKEVKTVWVTYCAGKNQWRGKVQCPVALPFWEYRHEQEKRDTPQTDLDSRTGATPRQGSFVVTTLVPDSSRWDYYIEVNAAGDYNEYFPYWSATGMPDSEGNGQPSVIYRGSIRAIPGERSIPELVGRTEQLQAVNAYTEDRNGIQNARDLLMDIQVISRQQGM